MAQLDRAILPAHPHADRERPHAQRVDIDPAPHGRVGRVEHLESAVEQEAVHLVGALAAADDLLRLEQHDVLAGLRQAQRAAQAGQARPDHHRVVRLHALHDRWAGAASDRSDRPPGAG